MGRLVFELVGRGEALSLGRVNSRWHPVRLGLAEAPGLAVIVDGGSGEESGRPRLLRQLPGAAIYAGLLLDGKDQIKREVEIWFQECSSLAREVALEAGEICNPALDRRWERLVSALNRISKGSVHYLGWETKPAEPLFLSASGAERQIPDERWALCRDEEVLSRARLAAYHDSRHRYLWNGREESPRFIAVTEGAPEGPGMTSFAEACPGGQPLNREGGQALIRDASALSFDAFVALLRGSGSLPKAHEKQQVPMLRASGESIARRELGGRESGFFFRSNHLSAHLGEVAFLKLAALHAMFQAVRDAVEELGTPFFNLSPDSFGISFSGLNPRMPYFWNHEVNLQVPPAGFRFDLGDVREPLFVPLGAPEASIYRANWSQEGHRGTGEVVIRRISSPDSEGLVVIEGTLRSDHSPPETFRVGRRDLLSLQWRSARLGQIQIVANLASDANPAQREYPFLSLQTRLPGGIKESSQLETELMSAPRINYEYLPRWGTSLDLHALAVIAVETLLVNESNTLGQALHDLDRLVRGERQPTGDTTTDWSTGAGTESLWSHVRGDDPAGWTQKLGPQRLVNDPALGEATEDHLPPAFWWEVVETLGNLLPGVSPRAFCKGADDFNPRAPHLVFEEPIEALALLVERARLILFGDPGRNRELRDLIRSQRTR